MFTNVQWNAPVWAEQGYIVVAPNITGSVGFGLEHTESKLIHPPQPHPLRRNDTVVTDKANLTRQEYTDSGADFPTETWRSVWNISKTCPTSIWTTLSRRVRAMEDT